MTNRHIPLGDAILTRPGESLVETVAKERRVPLSELEVDKVLTPLDLCPHCPHPKHEGEVCRIFTLDVETQKALTDSCPCITGPRISHAPDGSPRFSLPCFPSLTEAEWESAPEIIEELRAALREIRVEVQHLGRLDVILRTANAALKETP